MNTFINLRESEQDKDVVGDMSVSYEREFCMHITTQEEREKEKEVSCK